MALVLQAQTALSAVTLNFQQIVNNGTLPIGTIVTDQYAGQGVVFSVSPILYPQLPGPIADQFPGFPETSGLFNSVNHTPILANFSLPVRTVTFAGIVDSPVTVQAFDNSGTVLATRSSTGAALSEINTFTDIARLSFFNDSGTGYAGRSDLTIISTLSYTPVPEPGTLCLLALGGLAFLFRRLK